MDIIDFVQDICGWQLSEWQIEFTRTLMRSVTIIGVDISRVPLE